MKIQNRPPKTEFSYWLRLWLAEAQSHMAVTASKTFLQVRACPIYLWSLWHLCSKEASLLPLWRLTSSWRLSYIGSWSTGPRSPRGAKALCVSVVNEVTQWEPLLQFSSVPQLNTALFLTSLWYLSFWIFNWPLCSFPSAAVTKYNKLGDLTTDVYFPVILEAKFKIKVLTGLRPLFHPTRKDYLGTGMSTLENQLRDILKYKAMVSHEICREEPFSASFSFWALLAILDVPWLVGVPLQSLPLS